MSVFPEGLEPVADLLAAAWVSEAIGDHPRRSLKVADLVPPVFDAYARVLHGIQTEEGGRLFIKTWAQRAAELGRSVEPSASWWEVIGTAPFGAEQGQPMPEIGRLRQDEVGSLASSLGGQGGDACWFGIWSGWGFLSPGGQAELRPRKGSLSELLKRRRAEKDDRRSREALPPQVRVLGGPQYLLVAGTVNDAVRFTFDGWFQSPSLWWSDDRAWFLHTDFDAMSTFVGGSRGLVDELVGQQILESFEVRPDDRAAL